MKRARVPNYPASVKEEANSVKCFWSGTGAGVRSPEAGNEPRGTLLIGGIVRKAAQEDECRVAHAQDVTAEVGEDEERGRERRELDQGASDSDLLGKVKRVADDGVGAVGHEPAGFGHDAERAAEPKQDEHGEHVADQEEERREDMKPGADIRVRRQKGESVEQIATEERRQAWLQPLRLGQRTRPHQRQPGDQRKEREQANARDELRESEHFEAGRPDIVDRTHDVADKDDAEQQEPQRDAAADKQIVGTGAREIAPHGRRTAKRARAVLRYPKIRHRPPPIMLVGQDCEASPFNNELSQNAKTTIDKILDKVYYYRSIIQTEPLLLKSVQIHGLPGRFLLFINA